MNLKKQNRVKNVEFTCKKIIKKDCAYFNKKKNQLKS